MHLSSPSIERASSDQVLHMRRLPSRLDLGLSLLMVPMLQGM